MRARATSRHLCEAAEGFPRQASKYSWMRQATLLPPAPGRSSRAPAYPKMRPRSRRGASRGCPCSASSSSPGGCLPNEFIAVTGTNGKTTTTEWIGHIHREAGLPGRGGRQRRHRRLVAGRRRCARDARSSARRPRSSSRTPRRSRPRPRCCSTSPPDHLDRHGELRGLRSGQAADLRQPGRRRHRRARPAGLSAIDGPRRVRAAHVRSARRRRPSCPSAPASCGGTSEPLIRGRRDLAPRGAQPPERDGRRRRVPGARASTPRPWPTGCGASPGVAHRLERIAVQATASPTSTTRRPPTSRARWSRSRRSRAAST